MNETHTDRQLIDWKPTEEERISRVFQQRQRATPEIPHTHSQSTELMNSGGQQRRQRGGEYSGMRRRLEGTSCDLTTLGAIDALNSDRNAKGKLKW